MIDLDLLCREALDRLRQQTEARIDHYRTQSAREAQTTRRSMAQRMRWHTKQILREFGRG